MLMLLVLLAIVASGTMAMLATAALAERLGWPWERTGLLVAAAAMVVAAAWVIALR